MPKKTGFIERREVNTPSGKLGLVLKWWGGKKYLAPLIVSMMPPHLHYVEPYAGGAAVLLARNPDDRRLWLGTNGDTKGVSEVINDLDCGLINFWRVLGSERLFEQFKRRVETVPLARWFWEQATKDQEQMQKWLQCPNPPSIDYAVAFFIHCRQSMSGKRDTFTPLTRNRTRRGINGNASEWLGAVDGLALVHERMRRVVVEYMDAVVLIRREDTPTTFFYLDPDYLDETKTTKQPYVVSMQPYQHWELLKALAVIKGKFILSGYHSKMYDDFAKKQGWKCHEIDIANHASGAKTKKRMVECLWWNY